MKLAGEVMATEPEVALDALMEGIWVLKRCMAALEPRTFSGRKMVPRWEAWEAQLWQDVISQAQNQYGMQYDENTWTLSYPDGGGGVVGGVCFWRRRLGFTGFGKCKLKLENRVLSTVFSCRLFFTEVEALALNVRLRCCGVALALNVDFGGV